MALDVPYQSPLECGVALDDLIAQVTEGAAPLDRAHQAACEFCQAALEAIRRAWAEFQQFASAAVEVPGELAERVMRRVRELSTGEAAGILVAEERGQTRVAELVVERAGRAAAMAVPGVAWASVTAGGCEAAEPGKLRVQVLLVVGWEVAMPTLAQSVREAVIAAVGGLTGAVLDRVDVVVRDVVVEPEDV